MNKFECLNFMNFFIDFETKKFEKKQAKMIFEEIGTLLERRDYKSAMKHCNEGVIEVSIIIVYL